VNATLSQLRKDGYLQMRKRAMIVDRKALTDAMGVDGMLG
jgi:hypothetical protein